VSSALLKLLLALMFNTHSCCRTSFKALDTDRLAIDCARAIRAFVDPRQGTFDVFKLLVEVATDRKVAFTYKKIGGIVGRMIRNTESLFILILISGFFLKPRKLILKFNTLLLKQRAKLLEIKRYRHENPSFQ
jgi:hypothetical protein